MSTFGRFNFQPFVLHENGIQIVMKHGLHFQMLQFENFYNKLRIIIIVLKLTNPTKSNLLYSASITTRHGCTTFSRLWTHESGRHPKAKSHACPHSLPLLKLRFEPPRQRALLNIWNFHAPWIHRTSLCCSGYMLVWCIHVVFHLFYMVLVAAAAFAVQNWPNLHYLINGSKSIEHFPTLIKTWIMHLCLKHEMRLIREQIH